MFASDTKCDTEELVPICNYCKRNTAPYTTYYYEETMYWINKRTMFPLGYSYSEKKIQIPRCKKCFDKHMVVLDKAVLICFPIGYVLVAWGAYNYNDQSFRSQDGSWIGVAFAIFIYGLFLSGVLFLIFSEFMSLITKIPPEYSTGDNPTVVRLSKEGWIMSRPDAADAPETGDERRKRLQS